MPQRDRQVGRADVDACQVGNADDFVECRKSLCGLDHREHACPGFMRGGIEAEAGSQRPEAAHSGRCVAGRRHKGGGLFRRFDHRDDDGVGTGIEYATDRSGIDGRQSHDGGDRNVLQPPQQQRDVGVVEITVLDIESDVVVPGLSELLRTDDGRTHHPSAPNLFLGGEALLQPAGRHSTIAILTRSGVGRQARSNAACTSSTPKYG